jgi:putative (di)nucleoside polyphosphate hydrolase
VKTGAPDFYRPNVGLMLIGPGRRIFVGRRLNQPDAWQMPQGGVDKGETPVEAACRELREEVGTTEALLLRETRDWIAYDVPAAMHPPHWKGRWRGQAQKWFALAFTGRDSDIDLAAHDQEFDAWRWVPASELVGGIVPWKRPVYQAVVKEFSDLLSVDRAHQSAEVTPRDARS